MIETWTATCMQVYTHLVNEARDRETAMAILGKNLSRWEELIGSSARNAYGKQLLLFPEFALTGFPLSETAEEWIEKACIEIPGPETDRLQRKAQEYSVYIGANSYERDPEWPGRYFNCSYIIAPNGDVLIKYRRINTVHTASPHDFMDKYLDKYGLEGTFPVAKTELGNLSIMPCGEIMYPEAARMFMFRGAEVLLHPTSDHGPGDKWAWESAKKVRASENMMYLVSTNTAGFVGGPLAVGNNLGYSKIIDFEGRILAEAHGPGESTVASATIDVEGLRRMRQIPGAGNRLLRQRIDIYRPLYDQTTFYPPNKFSDKPMDSKKRIMDIQQEALINMAEAGAIVLPSDEIPKAAK